MADTILAYLNEIQRFIEQSCKIPFFNVLCHLFAAIIFGRISFGFFNEVVETRKKAFDLVSELLEIKKDGNFTEYRKYVWKYAVITAILVIVIVYSQRNSLDLSWIITYTILGPFVLKSKFVDPIVAKDITKVAGVVSNNLPNVLSTVDNPYQEEKNNFDKAIRQKIASMGINLDEGSADNT